MKGSLQKEVYWISGDVASGKTSVSMELARMFGTTVIYSGKFYRALTAIAMSANIDPSNVGRLVSITENFLDPRFESGRVFQSGEDITDSLNTADVTRATPIVAGHQLVRLAMAEKFRRIANEHDVYDGQDGEEVFGKGNIICSFYLTAPVKTRAIWRAKQLGASAKQSIDEIERDLITRQTADENRGMSPLSKGNLCVIHCDKFSSPKEVAGVICDLCCKAVQSTAA